MEYISGVTVVTIKDIEELNNLAEEVIIDLRYCWYEFDENGNDVLKNLPESERLQKMKANMENSQCGYLNFYKNEELQKLSFKDAMELSLKEIREKYLVEILPLARTILRKDPRLSYGMVVSDEIEDEYLDNLLALRWKENLKLWTMQWAHEKNYSIYIEGEGRKLEAVREDIPHFDRGRQCWRVKIDGRLEEGSLLYVVSEFVKDGLYYPFKIEESVEKDWHDHEHSFEGVISSVLQDPENFNISDYEEYYSEQERELLEKIRRKVIQLAA